jgi:hypothetical protein
MRFFKLKIKMPKFVTCINCIDGRTQLPVIEFLRRKYDVDFVDLITIPGADGVLAGGERKIIELVKKKCRNFNHSAFFTTRGNCRALRLRWKSS